MILNRHRPLNQWRQTKSIILSIIIYLTNFWCKSDRLNSLEKSKFIITCVVVKILTIQVILNWHRPMNQWRQTKSIILSIIIYLTNFRCNNDRLNSLEQSKFIITCVVFKILTIQVILNWHRPLNQLEATKSIILSIIICLTNFQCENDRLNWLEQSKFIITCVVVKILTIQVILNWHRPLNQWRQTKSITLSIIICLTNFRCENDRLNWLEQSKFIITCVVVEILTIQVILNRHCPLNQWRQTKSIILSIIVYLTNFRCKNDRLNWL